MADTLCRHCGQRIVRTHYQFGSEWTHQHAGASFQDGQHDYCHRTLAEPEPTSTDTGTGRVPPALAARPGPTGGNR